MFWRLESIALAAYINPAVDINTWSRMIDYNSGKVSILVANVLNGPDSKKSKAWEYVLKQGKDSGKMIIGYVRTGYLGVSDQKFVTMLGSHDLADWIAQIETDVDLWYK